MDAEERGQAEAIAHNLREMSRLPVPIIVTITGEGGSGGALAIAVGDRIYMLENSVYSVISPEGCASIMWRDSDQSRSRRRSVENHRREFAGIEDSSTKSCRNPKAARTPIPKRPQNSSTRSLTSALGELSRLTPKQLVDQRYEKFRRMGQFFA